MRSILRGTALSLVWTLASLAAAFGPEDALRYKDPRADLAKAQFDAAQQALQLAQGGFGAKALPTLALGQSPDAVFLESNPTGTYGLRLELGWTLNPGGVGQLTRDLEDRRQSYPPGPAGPHPRVAAAALFARGRSPPGRSPGPLGRRP